MGIQVIFEELPEAGQYGNVVISRRCEFIGIFPALDYCEKAARAV